LWCGCFGKKRERRGIPGQLEEGEDFSSFGNYHGESGDRAG
jgi:hypothetical protein